MHFGHAIARVMPVSENSSLHYVYGLTRGPYAGPLASGVIPGAVPQFAPVTAGLWAVIGFVSAAVAESWQEPATLAAAALAHHEMILSLHALGDVIPFRFGTVFASLADLQSQIEMNAAHYRQCFEKIGGAEEVEIRLMADLDVFVAHHLDTHRAELGALSPGRRYLVERQLRRQCAEQWTEVKQSAWKALEQALPGGPWPSQRLDADRRVFLWPRKSQHLYTFAEKFHQSQDGLRFSVNGVWPPYSFVTPQSRLPSEAEPVVGG
jgi:hypothetical protein